MTATMTLLAPARRSARAAAEQVAPVVRTSLTSRMVRPSKRAALPGAERLAQGLGPVGGRQHGQLLGIHDAPERPADRAIELSGQAARQRLGLVVAALPVPPPVQRDRDDPGVRRQDQPVDGLDPRLDPQVAEPRCQPGVAIVLHPQAELAERPFVGPQRDRPPRTPASDPGNRRSRPAGRRTARPAAHTAGRPRPRPSPPVPAAPRGTTGRTPRPDPSAPQTAHDQGNTRASTARPSAPSQPATADRAASGRTNRSRRNDRQGIIAEASVVTSPPGRAGR